MKTPIIGIIYSGYGNVAPIINILKMNGITHKIVECEADFIVCDKIIIPGVGSFDPFIEKLKNKRLDQVILKCWQDKKPILGICIGAQILGYGSEEGKFHGLNILNMNVKRFDIKDSSIRIPHMGWNQIKNSQTSLLLNEIVENHRFYFVHSYHFVTKDPGIVLSTTNYGYDFPSIVRDNNVYAVQFHPEKSQKYGMQIIKNFSLLC